MDEVTTCRFCGVQRKYGHFNWCKVDRPPTGKEVAEALVLEFEGAVGEGPSAELADMARAYLHHSAGDGNG